MGSSRTCSPSMMFETSPVEVLSVIGEASTITVSEAAPISIFKFKVVTSATCSSTFFSASFLKPPLFIVMRYVPASSSGKEKLPSSLVAASRAAPVRSLTTLTIAPGTTAPLGSVSVPVIVPAVFCAEAKDTKIRRQVTKLAQTRTRIGPPPREETSSRGQTELGRQAS